MDQEDTVIHSLANSSPIYDKGPVESVLKGLGVAEGGAPTSAVYAFAVVWVGRVTHCTTD